MVSEMGGRCSRCPATEKLEFHHTKPRTWAANRVGRWSRLKLYREDWLRGDIELLCSRCNKIAGKPISGEWVDEIGG